MPTANISSLTHDFPYGTGITGFKSYWNVTLSGNAFYSGVYDAWCVNPTKFLSAGNTGLVNLYPTYSPASGYKLPNLAVPPSLFDGNTIGAAGAIDKLDNVNWLLNQHFPDHNAQFNISEVQLALWRLLGFTTGAQYLTKETIVENDVQALIDLANTSGEGFFPRADDVFAVLAEPTFNYPGTSTKAQPILIETKFVKVGDFVWDDLNVNGIQDANEPGIDGVTLTLTGTDAFGNPVMLTKTTGDNPATSPTVEHGFYLFDRLVPGTYTVTVDASNFLSDGALFGYSASPTLVGSDRAIDSNPNPSGTTPAALPSGAQDLTVDFGYYTQPPELACLGDFVWHDLNANGIQEEDEYGINGVTVTLQRWDGAAWVFVDDTVTATTGTDDPATPIDESAAGYYDFCGLTPGVDYRVVFENPDPYDPDPLSPTYNPGGYIFSPPEKGTNIKVDSNGPISPSVSLDPGEFDRTLDTGFYRPGSIHAFGYLDVDGNGKWDEDIDKPFWELNENNERFGKRFVLRTDLDGDGTIEDDEIVGGDGKRNDDTGQVDFIGLKPGTYTLEEFPVPDGYTLTTEPAAAHLCGPQRRGAGLQDWRGGHPGHEGWRALRDRAAGHGYHRRPALG